MTANRPRNTSNQACTVWRAGFAWLLLVALFAAAPATAVDQNAAQPDNNDDADISNLEDIYRIELVVFADTAAIAQQANSRDAGPEQEYWPAPQDLAYPEQMVFIRNGESASNPAPETLADPAAGSVAARLPELLTTIETQSSLAKAAAALQQRSQYRLLFHKAWYQSLTDRANAPAIPLTGGNRFDDWYELGGTVTLSRERFLHITSDLWLSEFAYRNEFHQQRPWYAQGEGQPNWLPALSSQQGEPVSHSNRADTRDYTDADNDYRVERTYVLREYRRLRRDEIHYLDHPVFGAIVMISKYQSEADGA